MLSPVCGNVLLVITKITSAVPAPIAHARIAFVLSGGGKSGISVKDPQFCSMPR